MQPDKPSAKQALLEDRLSFEIKTVPRWRAFFGNLRYLFKKVAASSSETRWLLDSGSRHRALLENVKALLSRGARPEVSVQPVESAWLLPSRPRLRNMLDDVRALVSSSANLGAVTAAPVQTDLLLETPPWFQTVFRELFLWAKGAHSVECTVTAVPVPVPELFREHRFRKSSILLSVAVHGGLLVLALTLPAWLRSGSVQPTQAREIARLDTTPLVLYLPPKPTRAGGGGGGGRRETLPASLGRLPRAADRQLTPPTPKIVNPDPKLVVEPTVVVQDLAKLPSIDLPQLGLPTGVQGPPSSGPGTGGGIGNGQGGGVGPGEGPGVGPGSGGNIGGGPMRVGGGVLPPTVLYKVEPTYSEAARKAHYQGTVLLSAIIRKDGTIEIVKILRGLGLGLDENAIDALKRWKFRPGTHLGVPVDVALSIEVNFSLR
ncbi:MAG: energy transducer TonB [Acidobacteriota bacterium]